MFSLPWYIYVLQFVAGLFLANGTPHFVQGISGNWFPTPFAIAARPLARLRPSSTSSGGF